MNNPQIVCPKCGVFNEINDTKCWKCKRPISAEEREAARDKFMAELPEADKNAFLEREKGNASPVPEQMDDRNVDYRTSIVVAKIISGIGWVACAGAVVIVLSAFAGVGKMGVIALPVGLIALIGGLILVIAGQTSRAVMDNTNYSRQMLAEMRKRA